MIESVENLLKQKKNIHWQDKPRFEGPGFKSSSARLVTIKDIDIRGSNRQPRKKRRK